MNKKNLVLTDIFNSCKERNNFIFHNDLVKESSKKHKFGNPFDVTKLDNTAKFPKILLKENYFLIHIGNGNHQFIKGIEKGFHKFEEITDIVEWNYKKSMLNEFDTSESNILSVGYNQRIIHDFLYEDIVANPKVYGSRRTKTSFEYYIENNFIQSKNLQMEIDQTLELNGVVTFIEGKNGFPDDFAVYQIFFPYLYYSLLKEKNDIDIKEINCCYLLRKKINENSVIRIYNYTFNNSKDMTSIKLLKSKQYNLIKK